MLYRPNFEKEFILYSDASNFGMGAVLCQEDDQPVGYYSKGYRGSQVDYSTIEKELCAGVSAMEYFQYYLDGRKFVWVTDHKPLLGVLQNPGGFARTTLGRLIGRALRFTFELRYKQGETMGMPDALSRVDQDVVGSVREAIPTIRNALEADPLIVQLIQYQGADGAVPAELRHPFTHLKREEATGCGITRIVLRGSDYMSRRCFVRK